MSDKKHIDRLFQEKFKDFEVAPDAAVWERIEAQLKEKKKRRVIPIWWRYAGVAATLLILLTIGNSYLSNNNIANDIPNQVVDGNNNNSLKQTENEESGNENYTHPSNSTIKNTEAISNNNVSNKNSSKPNINKTGGKNENVVHPSNLSVVTSTAATNKNAIDNGANTSTTKSNGSNTLPDTNIASENTIELANTSEEKTNKSSEINETPLDKTKVDNLLKTNKNNKELHIADTNTKPENTEIREEQLSISIEEAMELAKNKDEEEKETKNKWSVTPNAAPVFFNSLGKGSSIDPQFNNNSKSSETNLSYGVSASYAVNDKISVRSGINKVSLGYNTNDVIAFHAIGNQYSPNLSALNNDGPGWSSLSTPDISLLSSQNFANKSSQNFASTSGISTYINQSLSFIEVPLEIKYLISDKKLGIHVVGGFSSFFLNDNELYSAFEGNKIFLGEANNINKTSYSANFGFGLGYKVSKIINLNLEPMFKYQINTFNNTSGDFKPYFIGIYTGVGFKF